VSSANLPAPQAGSRVERLILAFVLILAAALRFSGLSWGLRHPPHTDERVFVENVLAMLAARDFDHRFYEYPGLFFYVLRVVLDLAPGGTSDGSGPYLLARAVVAAFGVAAVGLLYLWCARLFCRRAALLAAALLAVSPVAVETAHMVRPDVVLQAFVLLALLAFVRVVRGGPLSADVRAGVALGLAGAVKFSAVFLVPVYLVRRLLQGGAWVRAIIVAGLVAVGVFVAASPYAVLHLRDFLTGLTTQVAYHYEESRVPKSYLGMVWTYARIWEKTLGPGATALFLLGLWSERRRLREHAPWLLLPVTAVAVLATSDVHFDRFLLPFALVGFAFAGRGAVVVPARLWALAAAFAILPPLVESTLYVREVKKPSTRDQLLEWSRTLPEGTRVLTTLDPIGLDVRRLEVLQVPRPAVRAQVPWADVVALTARDDLALLSGLAVVRVFAQTSPHNGPDITVARVPASARDALYALPVPGFPVTASDNPGAAARATDGRLDTDWRTSRPQQPGDAFTVTFPASHRLAAVELKLGSEWRHFARELRLELLTEAGWHTVRTVPGRPEVDLQHPARDGYSQLLLLPEPVAARGLRLFQTRRAARRWSIAELVVFAVP
jgi:hypothetical protein